MNKTIYLREDEAPIWEKARELSNDKVSPIIVAALKRFIAEKEAEKKGFERIVVNFRDANENGIPKAKAFYGKWLIPPDEIYYPSDDWPGVASVAITAKGSVVIYSKNKNNDREVFAIFLDLSSAISLGDGIERLAATEALVRNGVPIEELDI